MAHRLIAIANATGSDAKLTSTEYSVDDCSIPPGITHTGGVDDDFIFIPDCSDSNYWNEHHISVAATDQSWAVSFWANDQQEQQLYWSETDSYSEANPVPQSKGVDESAIMIQLHNGRPAVTWTPWS